MTASRPLVGRTTLSPKALRHLVIGLARDIGRVPADEVVVTVRDDGGELALAVELPFAVEPLQPQTLSDRGQVIRDHVVTGLHELAARTARTVDIRFTALRRTDSKRVT